MGSSSTFHPAYSASAKVRLWCVTVCVGIGIDNDIELCLRQQSKSVSQVALCKCLVRASPGTASPFKLLRSSIARRLTPCMFFLGPGPHKFLGPCDLEGGFV